MLRCIRRVSGSLRCATRDGLARKERSRPTNTRKYSSKKETKEGGKEAAEEPEGFLLTILKSKLGLLAVGGVGVAVLNYGGSAVMEHYYREKVLNRLTSGLLPTVDEPAALPRKAVRTQIRQMLEPDETSRFFSIVSGASGSGKSTLVREECRAVGGGIGYIDVQPTSVIDFGTDLGAAFDFEFEQHMSLFNSLSTAVRGSKFHDSSVESPQASLRRSADALGAAAAAYRARVGRPFVLVIDSVDRLLRAECAGAGGRAVLVALLEYVNDWAKAGSVQSVLIAHGTQTVQLLQGLDPTRSRALPPLWVPDLSRDEARQYLEEGMGLDAALVPLVLQLAGGSLTLLERCARLVSAGLDADALRRRMLDMAEDCYEGTGLLDATDVQDAGLAAVDELLAAPGGDISVARFREIVADPDLQKRLLSGGVLRRVGSRVEFASALTALYAREELRAQVAPELRQHHRLRPPARWWQVWKD